MPRGDGTGPGGMGPMTGRGAGFCAGYGMPGAVNPARGQGCGMGWGHGRGGGGRGWRHQYLATGQPGWMRADQSVAPVAAPSPEAEVQMLRKELEIMLARIQEVGRHIEELGSQQTKKS